MNSHINLGHRFKLIDDLNNSLTEKEIKTEEDLDKKKKEFYEEVKKFKSEINELSVESNELIKKLYKLGNLLKEKVGKRDYQILKGKIESWDLEGFAYHNELEKMFKEYSN